MHSTPYDGSSHSYRRISSIDVYKRQDAVPLDHVDGDIRFENVSFHYEDHDDKVLSNVNLEVKPGDYVALVGTSGAGKTTLCSLIPRFYDVTEGAIYLDGKDIRKIKLKDLRPVSYTHLKRMSPSTWSNGTASGASSISGAMDIISRKRS